MNRLSVFYSWQSDLPDRCGRVFVRHALRDAASSIEKKRPNFSVHIDEATRDMPGSPNIPITILAKISDCDAFFCDISTINSLAQDRKVPNPNVTFELGYAVARVGWDRIILLFNDSFGDFDDDVPFDFDRHRASRFESTKDPTDKHRKSLTKLLEEALEAIIAHNPSKPGKSRPPEELRRDRDITKIEWIMKTLHLPTLDEHLQVCPNRLSEKILFFWEEFNGIMTNSLFHLNNAKLYGLFKSLHEAFYVTVKHDECYDLTPGGKYYVFTNPGDMPLIGAKAQLYMELVGNRDVMREKIADILAIIRDEYVEVDLDETNRAAWKEYVAFVKSQRTAFEA